MPLSPRPNELKLAVAFAALALLLNLSSTILDRELIGDSWPVLFSVKVFIGAIYAAFLVFSYMGRSWVRVFLSILFVFGFGRVAIVDHRLLFDPVFFTTFLSSYAAIICWFMPNTSRWYKNLRLTNIFDSISERTDWDVSGDMLWGYFFTDADRLVLERAAPLLDEMGYAVNSFYLSDKESKDEPDLWWLHVERVETHSADSLEKTNLMFNKFAEKHGIDSYDGMDVGPAFNSD